MIGDPTGLAEFLASDTIFADELPTFKLGTAGRSY